MKVLLHTIFENQVDLTPNALAIKSQGVAFSYAEIEKQANRLAWYLHLNGVVPGDRIAIHFKRSELPIVAMLGIMKAGAAYVPIDLTYPNKRILHIIEDAKVILFLTETKLMPKISSDIQEKVSIINILSPKVQNCSDGRIPVSLVQIRPEDTCYIIYTSGTTGRPKGVILQHYNLVHFVHSFNHVCRLNSSDRIYNGFSYGFDGSVEEMWMAFSNGASLIVATDEMTKLASEASFYINQEKVTVFSTVPTFVRLIEEPLPTLRLLILSGELCTPELVNRWAVNGCRMLNVYGPTETTVNATYWECIPGKKITIGKPIPGYTVHILDDKQDPVLSGHQGELYIGGNGVAQGYLNYKDLTDKEFIRHPDIGQRLFRTGDLVSYSPEGDLLFHGRIDTQVKIRGYRIELNEIESVLREDPNILASAVTLVQKDGLDYLAAYVFLRDKTTGISFDELLDILQQRLPFYMVPSYLEILDEVPLLDSGKIDKKRLPEAKNALISAKRTLLQPETEIQKNLVMVWQETFGVESISITDDFFYDLHGHSLLAAMVVSRLRSRFGLKISIQDIYLKPTIEKLAREIERTQSLRETVSNISLERPKPSKVFWIVNLLQFISLYLIYGILTLPFVIYVLAYYELYVKNGSLLLYVLATVGITLLIYPIELGLDIALKWIILGKAKAGIYPVYSFYYYRWWLVDRLQIFNGSQFLAGSPLMSLYYRLKGAKVGRNCMIDSHLCSVFDMVSIGDNTCIGNETQLLGYQIQDGYLRIGSIKIGKDCFIGIHSSIGINSKMEDNSHLGDISAIHEGQLIGKDESWQGSPSVEAKLRIPLGEAYQMKPILWGFLHYMVLNTYFLVLLLTIVPPVLLLFYGLGSHSISQEILSIILAGPTFVASYCLLTALLKYIVLNQVKPGTYKVQSFFYLRKWLMDSMLRLSIVVVKPLYTTIYLPFWIRMLGAKMGKHTEISTVAQISPELMEIGDESFFADGSMIGGRHFYKGYMEVSVTRIGKRSFIGNSAILPVGTSIGDHSLIGVLSVPPKVEGTIESHTDWLGSPSFRLPFRQKVQGFSDQEIYHPTLKMILQRYIVDGFRIYIPSTLQVIGVTIVIMAAYMFYKTSGILAILALTPLVEMVVALASSLIVVGIKWLLMGKIKPIIKPLWSPFVWFNEAVNGAYESVMAMLMLPTLGTPYFAPFLRMLGCKIGKNVYLGTNLFSEFDLVYIGNNVTLNMGVVIQNHLFEDRIMKASVLHICDGCNVGSMSVILYDSIMDEHSTLNSLSLVMKGEYLPQNTSWIGIPCKINL